MGYFTYLRRYIGVHILSPKEVKNTTPNGLNWAFWWIVAKASGGRSNGFGFQQIPKDSIERKRPSSGMQNVKNQRVLWCFIFWKGGHGWMSENRQKHQFKPWQCPKSVSDRRKMRFQNLSKLKLNQQSTNSNKSIWMTNFNSDESWKMLVLSCSTIISLFG